MATIMTTTATITAIITGENATVQAVIAGLDPAIHHFVKKFSIKMDPRVKPGGDPLLPPPGARDP
jgi:hypothetical protein